MALNIQNILYDGLDFDPSELVDTVASMVHKKPPKNTASWEKSFDNTYPDTSVASQTSTATLPNTDYANTIKSLSKMRKKYTPVASDVTAPDLIEYMEDTVQEGFSEPEMSLDDIDLDDINENTFAELISAAKGAIPVVEQRGASNSPSERGDGETFRNANYELSPEEQKELLCLNAEIMVAEARIATIKAEQNYRYVATLMKGDG
jgi:hypothetical protein